MTDSPNRPLTPAEQRLARWMLEHGTPEAAAFLPQLELAKVTPWKCACGCASINFQIQGHPECSTRRSRCCPIVRGIVGLTSAPQEAQ